ncbi:MAG: DUF2341 domain-containing protein, partial [Burkholderiales bacterium]|nr:DUF2341 domain-containing protein [Burkholderiales bacterium]
MKRVLLFALALFALAPMVSHAWWNQDWTARRQITVDTSDKGAALQAGAQNVPVLVRLHTGNFPFVEADMDGKDLRFIGSDDATPLKFHVELFDGVNELALIWVQVPKLDPGATQAIWIYYGNEKAVSASDSKTTYDGNQTLVLHFHEKDGTFKDATAYGHAPVVGGVTHNATGLADGSGTFDGSARLSWPAVPGLRIGAAGMTFSAWVKVADAAADGSLFSQQDGANNVQVRYEQGRVFARAFGAETGKVDLPAGGWHHVAVTLSDRLVLWVDGREAAAANVAAADLGGDVTVGDGFRGDIDEVQLSNVARPAGWIAAQAASQGEGARLVMVAAEGEAGAEDGGASYLGILLGSVTLDGWIVIVILMVMMVISFWVMFSKGVVLSRTDGANQKFLRVFANAPGGDLFAIESTPGTGLTKSSVYRIYGTAMRELHKRFDKTGRRGGLTPQSID